MSALSEREYLAEEICELYSKLAGDAYAEDLARARELAQAEALDFQAKKRRSAGKALQIGYLVHAVPRLRAATVWTDTRLRDWLIALPERVAGLV